MGCKIYDHNLETEILFALFFIIIIIIISLFSYPVVLH